MDFYADAQQAKGGCSCGQRAGKACGLRPEHFQTPQDGDSEKWKPPTHLVGRLPGGRAAESRRQRWLGTRVGEIADNLRRLALHIAPIKRGLRCSTTR